MTEFEVIVLIQELGRTITEQFNFWMATTFAVVIASYTAGERLDKYIRLAIAVLYLAACTVYFFRYLDAVESVTRYAKVLQEMKSDYSPRHVTITSYARRFVMFGGSILAMLMIFMPQIGATNKGNANDT